MTYRFLAILLVYLLAAGPAFSFSYTGAGADGFVTSESVTAANMNELDVALDSVESDVSSLQSTVDSDTTKVATIEAYDISQETCGGTCADINASLAAAVENQCNIGGGTTAQNCELVIPDGEYTVTDTAVLSLEGRTAGSAESLKGVTIRSASNEPCHFQTNTTTEASINDDRCSVVIKYNAPSASTDESIWFINGAQDVRIEGIGFIMDQEGDGEGTNGEPATKAIEFRADGGHVSRNITLKNVAIYGFSTGASETDAWTNNETFTSYGIVVGADDGSTQEQIDSIVLQDVAIWADVPLLLANGSLGTGGVTAYDTFFAFNDYGVWNKSGQIAMYNSLVTSWADNGETGAEATACDAAGWGFYQDGSTNASDWQPRDVTLVAPQWEIECGGLIGTANPSTVTNMRNSQFAIYGGTMECGDENGNINCVDFGHVGAFVGHTTWGTRGWTSTGTFFNFDPPAGAGAGGTAKLRLNLAGAANVVDWDSGTFDITSNAQVVTGPTPDDLLGEGAKTNGYALTYNSTGDTWGLTEITSGSGDITDVFNCASGDCASLVASDGDLLDFGLVDAAQTTEGLHLPDPTDCSSAVAEGQICWDSDDNTLYVGDGATALEQGTGSGATTDAGTVTHPTSLTDDFAVGGTTSAAPFFVDESTGDVSCNTAGCTFSSTPSTTTGDSIVLFEGSNNGSNTITFQAPNSVTTNITCNLEDDSTPLDACITPGGVSADAIGTSELDDGTDTPLSGEYLRVDTVDQAGVEYRTTAEVLSDIGAQASNANLTDLADNNDLPAGVTANGVAVQTGTDDDVPDAGDFGNATDLDLNGAISDNAVDKATVADDAIGDDEIDYSELADIAVGGNVTIGVADVSDLDNDAATLSLPATTTITTYTQTLLDDTTEGALHATINLEVGTDVQAYDAELSTIAALTETEGGVMFATGGAWTTDTTPAINVSDFTGSLDLGTGTIRGAVSVDTTDGTSPDTVVAEGNWIFTDDSVAYTLDLPSVTTSGQNFCVYSPTAHVITLHPSGTDVIVLDGTALTGGNTIDSAGGAGDFICLLSNGTNWYTLGRSGAWADGGA